MYKTTDEELVVCPYNRYHVISTVRLQRHILKCKKNYPDVHLLPCFYNYSHRLKPEEILEHYKTCPQKTRIEERRYLSEFYKPPSSKSCESLTSHSFYNQTRRTYYLNEFDGSNEKVNSFDANENSDYVHEESKTTTKDEIEYSEEELDAHSLHKELYKLNTGLSDSDCSDFDDYATKDDDDEDENLKPLSLPKTVSQAFALAQKEHNITFTFIKQKGFGRGLNFLNAAQIRSDEKLSLENTLTFYEEKTKSKNPTADVEDFEEYESVHFNTSCSDLSVM